MQISRAAAYPILEIPSNIHYNTNDSADKNLVDTLVHEEILTLKEDVEDFTNGDTFDSAYFGEDTSADNANISALYKNFTQSEPRTVDLNKMFGEDVSETDDYDSQVEFQDDFDSISARSLTLLKNFECEDRSYPTIRLQHSYFLKLKSPSFPDTYPNDVKCGWKIKVCIKNISLRNSHYFCV